MRFPANVGTLVIGSYISFISYPRRVDLPRSKHSIVWQPKFIADGAAIADRLPEGEIAPPDLFAVLAGADGTGGARVCHALEFAGARAPEQTVLHTCAGHLSRKDTQGEYWLIADDEKDARAHYDAFHGHDAALRFDCLAPAARQVSSLDAGLLRRRAADVLFLHQDRDAFTEDDWRFWREAAVAGGLALVSHDEDAAVVPAAGWTALRAGRRATLLRAPDAPGPLDTPLPGPRWVMGGHGSLAREWAALLDDPQVHVMPVDVPASGDPLVPGAYPDARDVRAIDYFCDRDPGDPTGERAVSQFVALVQSLVACRIGQAGCRCRLTVVTRRAVLSPEDARGSVLWGAVRSMVMEVVEEAGLDFRLVDLGAADDLGTLAWLARHDLRERELAVREGRLWAPRVVSDRTEYPRVPAGEDPSYRLFLENAGQIGGLRMKTYEPPRLGPHHVEIDVAAAALNFRDVMVTLGLLPALAYERSALGPEVGMEASGVVRRVGMAVEGLEPGDEVVLVEGGCIANRVVVGQHRVFPKPAGLGMEEAASSLSVYVTAYYALIHLAQLRRGQRVLIHSAMGGIGQAAIALANTVGAEIHATAGSEGKRDRLRELGVRAAFDSRSEEWFEGLMKATGGQGVDVVLNSLAGRHVPLCLKALRAGGWHCEIGKVDIYADSALGLRAFRKNLRFAAIDLDRLMVDDPSLSRSLSETCLELLHRGAVPPLPVTVFPYADHAKAFRLMTSGQHQGKLVLKAPPTSAAGPGGNLSGDRGPGRLRPAAPALPRDGRRPPPHPHGPGSGTPAQRGLASSVDDPRRHRRGGRDRPGPG